MDVKTIRVMKNGLIVGLKKYGPMKSKNGAISIERKHSLTIRQLY